MPDRTPEQIATLRIIREQIKADRALLVERYPACLCPKWQPKKPLKLWISGEIARAKLMPRTRLKRALRDYCGGLSYQRALVAGADRIGLDGQPTGTVSAGDAQAARNEIRHRENPRSAADRTPQADVSATASVAA